MMSPFLLNSLTVTTLSRVFSTSSSTTPELFLPHISDIYSAPERVYSLIYSSPLKTGFEEIQKIVRLSICWRQPVIWVWARAHPTQQAHKKIEFHYLYTGFSKGMLQCLDGYCIKSHLQQLSDQAIESKLPNILKKCCDWCMEENPLFFFFFPFIPW